MATKHEQILQHILSLEVGQKISVRQIAKDLNVSDGTAYRAIKEAENQGLVTSIERVGTIRIEKKKKENFERLTFAEVVNIIDGHVLGGRDGLHKTLSKFLIGAMEIDAMMRYTEAGSLLIVGNRVKAHEEALKAGAAVLITGGFDTEEKNKILADENELPIISTEYDTFTVASMINRAIYDQLIKKEVILVGDIKTPLEETYYLETKDTVKDWYVLNEESKHSRFPIVDDKMKVIGMVSSKDIVGQPENTVIDKVMSRKPHYVQPQSSLAYASHMMVWEGVELLPVLDDSRMLTGVVSRQDVLKAMQQVQRQPQVGETINDIITRNLTSAEDNPEVFETVIVPQMTNHLGTLGHGVFSALIIEASNRLLIDKKKAGISVENITVYFNKPVQMDSLIRIKPKILDAGRLYVKISVDVYFEKQIIGNGLIMAQLINR
ncbi:DRTGG domain-containing protein [Oceanobacillus sp. CAU 1775]